MISALRRLDVLSHVFRGEVESSGVVVGKAATLAETSQDPGASVRLTEQREEAAMSPGVEPSHG